MNNWKLAHVGVVVRDMDQMIEYYKSLGLVTEIGTEWISDNKELDALAYGKPADPKCKVRISGAMHIGPVELLLNQPLEGEGRQQDFLNSHGEGINHIAFFVDDLESEKAKMIEKGISIMFEVPGNVYFDTRKFGNVVIQLLQRRSK
jgi:4-hydroxyphenylpyruvate dioxygenase-like putative hemolysin